MLSTQEIDFITQRAVLASAYSGDETEVTKYHIFEHVSTLKSHVVGFGFCLDTGTLYYTYPFKEKSKPRHEFKIPDIKKFNERVEEIFRARKPVDENDSQKKYYNERDWKYYK